MRPVATRARRNPISGASDILFIILIVRGRGYAREVYVFRTALCSPYPVNHLYTRGPRSNMFLKTCLQGGPVSIYFKDLWHELRSLNHWCTISIANVQSAPSIKNCHPTANEWTRGFCSPHVVYTIYSTRDRANSRWATKTIEN